MLYEDQDFENDLVNLTSVSDLLKERATLKIVMRAPPNQQSSESNSNEASSLTSASTSAATVSQSNVWPLLLLLLSISYDAEMKLCQANNAHTKDGSVLDVRKELKTHHESKQESTKPWLKNIHA
ncbi:MAG: hypothetical protein ACRC7H_07090 [Plesiomonas shigelloides]